MTSKAKTRRWHFNTKGTKGDIDPSVKAFLSYLEGQAVDNAFVKELDDEVRQVKDSDHLKMQYASLYIRDLENFEKGVEQERVAADKEKLAMAKRFLNSGVATDIIVASTGFSERNFEVKI